MSKYIPMDVKYTPTTTKQSNAPVTTQVGPQEHLTWNHEDPPKGHYPHFQSTLIHYNNHHGPHLARHPVTHQHCIHTRDLFNKILHPTKRRGTDWQTHTQERGI